ncbi:MAG TPA: sigma-70 family RNA polymerase sigma factor [Bryobacteraceae bacterium]|jgi:RNA polymerase sigma-70 factor (ECF subfamily)
MPAAISIAHPAAFEEDVVALFDELQGRLLRYLLSLGLPASDSEEIIQEAFLALFLHLRSGKPRHNLRAWVFQVTHNLALKQRHRLLRRTWLSAQPVLIDGAPNPEDQFFLNERQRRLFGVWNALAERDRRCLSLRAEGLTYREIAHVLEMSLGAVSLSLTRSLARFARADHSGNSQW